MKTVDAGQFTANVNLYLHDSLSETIVVTQAGKPCAMAQGLDYDEEQLQRIDSGEFWVMIQQRRSSPIVPWELAKQRLESLVQ